MDKEDTCTHTHTHTHTHTRTGIVFIHDRVCMQCRRPGFDLWVGKIAWRRKWQPTPVFLPGESHGQRSLVGYIVHEVAESYMTEQLNTQTHTYT